MWFQKARITSIQQGQSAGHTSMAGVYTVLFSLISVLYPYTCTHGIEIALLQIQSLRNPSYRFGRLRVEMFMTG